jgi:NAD(P)-dependent dehydrogenase (short-subunit alcohol dehydrogenase family)
MTPPSYRLEGKVAAVTGGSNGLGRAMALGFAEAVADVVIASRKVEGCERVADEVRAFGRRALAVGCHVGDWEHCGMLMTRAADAMGGLDVLVNNAGIAPVPPSLGGITEALFDETIAVNLKGPVRLTGLAADTLRPGGAVVNISSLASVRPSPHTVVYAAAKAGVNALTLAAAYMTGALLTLDGGTA